MLKLAGLLVLVAGLSSASTLTFFTSSPTESGGNAISGEVDFMTSAGQLTITLKNLQSGATTVAQNISDLEFVLTSGLLGAGTGMTSFGQEIICSGGSCTPQGGTDPTGWGLGTVGTE